MLAKAGQTAGLLWLKCSEEPMDTIFIQKSNFILKTQIFKNIFFSKKFEIFFARETPGT